MWRSQRAFFDERFRVHTPTLPGHNPLTSDNYTTHARSAQSIAEQIDLPRLEGNIVVIGFSVGGQVAIEFAEMFPDRVTAVAVVSSLVRPWRSAALYVWLAGLAAPLAKRREFSRLQASQLGLPDDDLDAYIELSTSLSPTTVRSIMRTNFAFTPPAGFTQSGRPVLLIAGATEQRTLITNLQALGATLPTARAHVIDGAGHNAPFVFAADFNRLVDDWLTTSAL